MKSKIQQIILKSFGSWPRVRAHGHMVFTRQMIFPVAEAGTEPGLGFVQKRRKERITDTQAPKQSTKEFQNRLE